MQFVGVRKLTIKQTDRVAPGLYGAQICRTRYIDDTVQAALARGVRQLVILGAGLDTRPYRLRSLEQMQVFEVDLPAVQKNKKQKLHRYLGRLPDHVTFIPIDFDTQSLAAVFTGTAFDPAKPSFFIWEGVTQYLTAAAVHQTLTFVGKAAPGSSIVFTYVLQSIIERRSDIPGAARMMDTVAKQAPWLFGLESAAIPAFLQPFQLRLSEDVGNADYQTRYLQPLQRKLTVFEGERIVQAVVD
jgi:methyltransferase (TIGR00027 family)